MHISVVIRIVYAPLSPDSSPNVFSEHGPCNLGVFSSPNNAPPISKNGNLETLNIKAQQELIVINTTNCLQPSG